MNTWGSVNIRSYQDAERYYRQYPKRHWPEVELYHNTYLHRDVDGDAYHIIYHATTVVSYYKNGVIHVDNGHYQTATTKARINDHIPMRFSVWQKDWKWYITIRPSADDPNWNETTIPYHNGFVDSWLVVLVW